MSTQIDDPDISYDDSFFQQSLPQYYRAFLKGFRRTAHSFISFNLLFFFLFSIELCGFIPMLTNAMLLALGLSVIFLTVFSYLILLFYFSAKKPEQLLNLCDHFIQSCRQVAGSREGDAQHHLSIAAALYKLSAYLEDFEWNFYKIPKVFARFGRMITRFSAYCYWDDVFKMKQMLLAAAIQEHLQQIRTTPTDLEVHASLANTYVALSKIYRNPSKWHPRQNKFYKYQDLFDRKFQAAANLALQEFQILSQYAPNDPWVHEQLASGYKDLKLAEEEIREVEVLLKLRPQDREIQYRLGLLYFAQGQNAKGLQIYENLKKTNFKKAEDLISAYGQTKPLEELS